ncbi:acyltransferase [Paractinoplanes deccanensis]|uniref:Acyltransferase n=1 Tax=Paractinoplanes deccanensis TaxID=113561 RepID=A0ABQ3Y1U5_9ACTN|nr:acyltransferase family protein [Actinoplanes deccanensis]GID73973.1 acyltransferase [Actinoplanes deccanensis]
MVSTTVEAREAPAGAPASRAEGAHIGFRPDIEGLRAVAVTLVVLSHAGLSTFAGGYVGVDVFFVISGFLITTLLLKELTRTGRISLPGFYARRAIRLLPVSTVVVVATIVAAGLFVPATRFRSITEDGLFSTFYGINWRLAYEGTDYLNATAEPSPLQHLWSLAVEEQFYLIWPLLLLAVWAGRRARRRAAIALTALVVVSLALSVQQTRHAEPWAYFGSHTRAWELGIGALVAIAAGRLRRTPKALAAVLTWGGLVAVLVAALRYNEATAFPGHAALLPVLGTAAVIAGGSSAEGWGAGRLIGTAPFRFIGKLSYGWYLWHWPILMIWPLAFMRDPGVKSNLVFAAGALGLAFVTYHLVENPVRTRPWLRSRARRGLALGLVLSVSTAAIALVAGRFTPPIPTGPATLDTAAEVGAAADPAARLAQLVSGSVRGSRLPENVTPKLTDAKRIDPKIYDDLCHLGYPQSEQNRPCVYGDPNGAKTMYLIGDSHAAAWFPAVDEAARAQGWKLVTLTKAACHLPEVLAFNPILKRPYTECVAWRDQVLDRVAAARPDLVVMATTDLDSGIYDENNQLVPSVGPQDNPVWVSAWQQTWDRLRGIPKVLIQDTPYPLDEAPECAATNPRQLYKCDRTVNRAIREPQRRASVAERAARNGIRVIDPTPWFCTDRTCPIVVGNTLVYKDDNHITVAYAEVLGPVLERALFPARS